MIITIKPENAEKVEQIFKKHEVPYAFIGQVTNTKNFVAFYKNNKVVDLPIEFLVNGFEEPERKTISLEKLLKERRKEAEVNIQNNNLKEYFEKLLKYPNISSKKWVYQQYDFTVQARTEVSPGSGSAILRLENNEKIALTLVSIPYQVYLDPFHGAANSATEAIRNVVSTGAQPIALVDNLNFGNPEKEDAYTEFVESVKGIAKVTNDFKIPVVGGNVSLYNETISKDGQRKKILPTPVIGIVGIIPKNQQPVKPFFQKTNSFVVLIGPTKQLSLEGSEFYRIHGVKTGIPPKYDPENEKKSMKTILESAKKGILESANDVGRGGLLKTLVKMSIEKRIGIITDENPLFSTTNFWFSESPARYVVEVSKENLSQLEKIANNYSANLLIIGKTTSENSWKIRNETISLEKIEEWYESTIPSWMEA